MAAQLERETQALLASLEERVERRMEELRMSLNANVMKKIRLSSADLKVIGFLMKLVKFQQIFIDWIRWFLCGQP